MNPALLLVASIAAVSPSRAATNWNDPPSAFAWAPDGRQIAYCGTRFSDVSSGSQVWLIDAVSGSRRAVLQHVAPCRVVWHPSSNALMIEGLHDVVVVDLVTGQRRTSITSKGAIQAASFSPDGKWISYLTAWQLIIGPFKGGASRMIARNAGLDWLYRNKLQFDTSYWWSPDSSAIAYLETVSRPPESKHFAVAGEALPHMAIRIAGLAASSRVRTVQLPAGEAYLPQISWTPDSRALAIQRLDRRQTTLTLLLADAATGETTPILKETDAYWINSLPRRAVFLPGEKRFLWMSERSGFNHIYLYESSGQLVEQLTEGDWEVTSIDAVDDHSVYFTSTRQSPIERHIYRRSLDSAAAAATRLTRVSGWHTASFSANAKAFLDFSSSSTELPSVSVVDENGHAVSIIQPQSQLPPVEFSTVTTHDGLVLNTMLIRPIDFDPARKYPALILAPAGPRTQIVRNACDSADLLWARTMARQGFVVFAVDGRGSGGRGRRFEEPIHYRLGGMELPDQLDALAYLRRLGYVDMKRLGVWGSRYGGMLAIGAMMHSPGIYFAGFAESPITDWTAVDAFTAERYLGPLTGAGVPYTESSPNEFAGKLQGRLHVMGDLVESPVHIEALREKLEEKHKLKADRATIAFASRASLLDRATQFFIETLLR